MRWKFCAVKWCCEWRANFSRAAESKIADFHFFFVRKKKFITSPAIVFCGTLQVRFPPLGFSSPATARFAVDNDVQPARCSSSAMTPSADSE
jgi:hypothetical protein